MLTLYALLEGPSVTGAYEFLITPGVATVFEVRAELRFRQAPELPGIAPLSSMFWYGENTPRPAGEARPEVHDSDGLLVQARGGERLWRPLRNPGAPAATDFPGQPVAFGLLQRDRNLADYEDLEARYDLRPSAWIEPLGAGVPAGSGWSSCRRAMSTATTSWPSGCRPRSRPAGRTNIATA